MATPKLVEFSVNGTRHSLKVDTEQTLLNVLRDELDLSGTKYGCGEGKCGACVVLIDGYPTPSCITPATSAVGSEVVTIEGLSQNGALHPLQQAFVDAGALQCGYCSPGMIMEGVALLARNPDPTAEEIVEAMDRHICRCGAYSRIVRAIQLAGAALREQAMIGAGS